MKDLIIIGASGFGREVAWLVERINAVDNTWNFIGFLDDNPKMEGKMIDSYPVLGNCDKALDYSDVYFVCAIGSSRIRKTVVEKMGAVNYATLIDPSVLVSDRVSVGEGTIICGGSIITVDISIGNHVIVNLDCTIGHDAFLHDFVTLYPSVNVSGNTDIGEGSEVGTGAQIIQMKKIGSDSIVGAGAVVVKDIPDNCTAVGSPAKPIKFHVGGVLGNNRGQAMACVNKDGCGTSLLIIIGASGQGEVVADIASYCGYKSIAFLDDNISLKSCMNYPVIGVLTDFRKYEGADFFVAIGNPKTRENVQQKLAEMNVVSLVHPDAVIAPDVAIGRGTAVMAGAVINPGSVIGESCIINTGATVDHDNRIEDFVHVSVGCHLAGTVTVGKSTWIGAGAVVSNNVNICGGCTIGAGAVVVKDISEPGTYVGVPVKRIET